MIRDPKPVVAAMARVRLHKRELHHAERELVIAVQNYLSGPHGSGLQIAAQMGYSDQYLSMVRRGGVKRISARFLERLEQVTDAGNKEA